MLPVARPRVNFHASYIRRTMRDLIVSVQTALAEIAELLARRHARSWRPALLAMPLIGSCGAMWGQNLGGGDPAAEQLGPPAAIEGFRQARFGMNEEEVKQAIRKDFPAAGKLTTAIHPTEKTTVLSLTTPDLLPHSGNARIPTFSGTARKSSARSISSGPATAAPPATRRSSGPRIHCATISRRKISSPTASSPTINSHRTRSSCFAPATSRSGPWFWC